jgi:hypothetical protein
MKKLLIRIAACLLLAALPMFPAENGNIFHSRNGKILRWSLIAARLSASADVSTSLMADGRPGLQETDPLIGKQLGARGTVLEFGSRGLLTAVEIFVLRRHPGAAPYFAAGNTGLSITSSAAATDNARLLLRSMASRQ